MSVPPRTAEARALIDAMGPVLALPIAAESRDAVVMHLARLLVVGDLVTEFELPDDVEIAPVFQP